MDLNSFIAAFFKLKHLTLVTAFLCWRPEELSRLYKLCADSKIRLLVQSGRAEPELLPYRTFREGMLLDATCPFALDLIRKASASRAFNLRHAWLVVGALDEAMLAALAVLPDGELLAGPPLRDLYRAHPARPLTVTPLADDYEQGLAALATLPTAVARRRNLGNISLAAATIISQPQHFKGWSDLRDRQIDTFPKFIYPLMMLLAEDLNFRYNMRQVEEYGEEVNGSFDGLAGLLQRGRAHVGVATLFMRRDRWQVLHFCAEGVALVGAFIFRQPPKSAVSNVFLLPFSGGVWVATGAAVVGAATLLAALGAAARLCALPEPAAHRLTLAETFTFAIGAICQQGSDVSPRLVSARLLWLSALLSSLFAFTSYSAKIVSILQAPSAAIQTIDHLADSPMTLGVQDTTYKNVYFRESKDPATQRLYRRKLQPLGERAYLSVLDGIARVRTGLFAFQVEQSSGYDVIKRTYTEREKCGLGEVQAFRLPMVAVPLAKHSGYRDLFACRLRWQREVGLTSRWRRVWMEERVQCAGGAGFGSVRLPDVLPALLALLAGAAAAAALLLAELLLKALR